MTSSVISTPLPKTISASRLQAFLCALGFVACELLCRPYAEMGVCDDWSYVRTVQLLSQTGHLHYNGYATAMIGWQLYFATAFVKVFGFSFTSVRASTLVVSVITTFLMERTLVRAGIKDNNAVITTLALVLSPLYMPLSATFMSDTQGLLAIILTFYSCLRALQTASARNALYWIVFSVFSNLIIGSSRQIAWLGILVIIPSTLWLMRKQHTILWFGSATTVLGIALIASGLHWFQLQLYSVPEHLIPRIEDMHRVAYMASQLSRSLLEIPFLLLAISVSFLPQLRRMGRRLALAILTCCITYAVLVVFVSVHHGASSMLEPLLGDWVGPHGGYEGILLNGHRPIVLAISVRIALTFLSIGALLCFLATFYQIWRSGALRTMTLASASPVSWQVLCALLAPFTTVYFFLLIPRSASQLLDRYLLALLFVFALVAVRLYQDFVNQSLPTLTIIMVAIIAVYGIGNTHDMFALYRARVRLVDELLAAGVPQNSIDGGLEYNGWVELQQSSHVNDERIINPPGAFVPVTVANGYNCQGERVIYSELAHYAPHYGLSFDSNSCIARAPIPPVSYFRWLSMSETPLYAVTYERGMRQAVLVADH